MSTKFPQEADVNPSRTEENERFSPTEVAEMAHSAVPPEQGSLFRMSSFGHAMLYVTYDDEKKIAQNDTHQKMQKEWDMVLVGTRPSGEHEVARYMHRDHYDNAVLEEVIHLYQ